MTQSEFKGQNPKKNTVMHADDLMLSAKLAYEEMRELRGTKVGVIPMAGRPVHAGHWCLIENALKENDTVYLFVSIKARGEGLERIEPGTMVRAWKEVLLPVLPKNVVVRFVENPVLDAFRFVKDAIENPLMTFTFYGDDVDAAARFSEATLSKTFSQARVRAVGLRRSDTVQISATEIRKMLAENALASQIMATFPKVLSEPAKKRYFKILTMKA
jgi:ATP sulfurylase